MEKKKADADFVIIVCCSRHQSDENMVDVSQMENLWDAHASCVTLMQLQLVRTVRLVQRFPVTANCTCRHDNVLRNL